MKILCLHGTGTNATVRLLTIFILRPLYRPCAELTRKCTTDSPNPTWCAFLPFAFFCLAADILSCEQAPVKYELAKTEKAEFCFVNGPIETPAATGVSGEFEGPYYRFFDDGAPHINQMTGSVKSCLQQARSPEDYGRRMREIGMGDAGSSRACDFLQDYVEQHDDAPFDGVLGFSEGASVAASLILRQSRRKQTIPFKFAVFICAIPPYRSDRDDIMLADETDERLDIPTAHIVGSKDAGYQGSKALYNLCHQPSASIFDHVGAHEIPWDLATTQGIAKEIRSVGERSQNVPIV